MELPAGDFSLWLRHARKALHGENGIEVACGECIGCCSSSYFIHVNPEDVGAYRLIPGEVLFSAPGLPDGHFVMGYDKNGLCPMMKDGKCSIYEHRPKTCRDYDCRMFTAAGLVAGGDEKAVINQRIEQWKFSYPTALDGQEHRAVLAAVAFIQNNAEHFPGGRVPDNPNQLAILAIKAYDVFLDNDGRKNSTGDEISNADTAKAVVNAVRKFDDETTYC